VNTKNMFVRFSIHQINASSSYYNLSKFYCRKRHGAMQNLFIKKERENKKVEKEKIDKCSRYLKQWVLRYPPKKEMNEIASAL
jgi:hypothetical protein